MLDSNFIDKVKEYLIEKYNCHSIVLYGSYANNTETSESDIDLICFSDECESENDTSIFQGVQLDAWIYSTKMIENSEELLHIRDGKVIHDEKGLSYKLLQEINEVFNKGPKKKTDEEKEFLVSWMKKMLRRAGKGDIEGDFRYHWLLVDSLEIYFNLRDLWYLGPKKSLRWIKENDEITYELYREALNIGSSFTEVEKLIRRVSNKE